MRFRVGMEGNYLSEGGQLLENRKIKSMAKCCETCWKSDCENCSKPATINVEDAMGIKQGTWSGYEAYKNYKWKEEEESKFHYTLKDNPWIDSFMTCTMYGSSITSIIDGLDYAKEKEESKMHDTIAKVYAGDKTSDSLVVEKFFSSQIRSGNVLDELNLKEHKDEILKRAKALQVAEDARTKK